MCCERKSSIWLSDRGVITHYTTISYSAAVCTVERKPQETINIDIGSAEWLHYRGVATLHTTVNYSEPLHYC